MVSHNLRDEALGRPEPWGTFRGHLWTCRICPFQIGRSGLVCINDSHLLKIRMSLQTPGLKWNICINQNEKPGCRYARVPRIQRWTEKQFTTTLEKVSLWHFLRIVFWNLHSDISCQIAKRMHWTAWWLQVVCAIPHDIQIDEHW